jgi:hypothetical protein
MGLLQKDGDVGMFVSSGGFTLDAKNTARGSHVCQQKRFEGLAFAEIARIWKSQSSGLDRG